MGGAKKTQVLACCFNGLQNSQDTVLRRLGNEDREKRPMGLIRHSTLGTVDILTHTYMRCSLAMIEAALDSLWNGNKTAVKSFHISSAELLGDRGLTRRKEGDLGLGAAHIADPRHLVPPLGELFTGPWVQCDIQRKHRGV